VAPQRGFLIVQSALAAGFGKGSGGLTASEFIKYASFVFVSMIRIRKKHTYMWRAAQVPQAFLHHLFEEDCDAHQSDVDLASLTSRASQVGN
jgi:hypothetical protein